MTSSRWVRFSLIAFAAGSIAAQLQKADRKYFNRKVVFITGGSRGLGLILIQKLLAMGAKVSFCARNEIEIHKALETVSHFQNSENLLGVRADVSSAVDMEQAIAQTMDHFGHLDIIVNNAGIMHVAPFDAFKRSEWESMINVNFWGVVNSTFAALPFLKEGSKIVNITSIGAAIAVPHLSSYSSAKFGALGFSLAMQSELASRGIRVVSILPGLMRTGSYFNAEFKGKPGQEFGWFSFAAKAPVISMNAERAAAKILTACRKGTPFSTL